MRPNLEKTHHKKELVEWLKVQTLSSNPSTAKKKKKKARANILVQLEVTQAGHQVLILMKHFFLTSQL
jgi:hypothetical protein